MSDERRTRRRGSFVRLTYDYADDHAVIAAGEAAELLYVRGLTWCKRPDARADGFISDAELARVGRGLRRVQARADRLCEVGLWVRDDTLHGWHIRTWLDWNLSIAEVDELRRKDAARKRQGPP